MEQIRYTVFNSNKTNLSIGYDREFKWIVTRGVKEYQLNGSADSFVACLPLLEEDFFLFHKALNSNTIISVSFPLLSFILFGLKSGSLYWINLASTWLINYSSLNNVLIQKSDFESIYKNQKIPQKIRHWLKKNCSVIGNNSQNNDR